MYVVLLRSREGGESTILEPKMRRRKKKIPRNQQLWDAFIVHNETTSRRDKHTKHKEGPATINHPSNDRHSKKVHSTSRIPLVVEESRRDIQSDMPHGSRKAHRAASESEHE